jgi:hypothetical protein
MKSGSVFIAWLLFPLALLQGFGSLMLYADYLLEKKAYVQYCQNKDKPNMHCEGKCVLSKKIAQHQYPLSTTEPTLKIPDWPPFKPADALTISEIRTADSECNLYRTVKYAYTFVALAFHPPQSH